MTFDVHSLLAACVQLLRSQVLHTRTIKWQCLALQWPKHHWICNSDCYFFSFRTKIFVETAGNTLQSHVKFVKKLKKKGAKVVTEREKSDFTILFCPIVSRFECDITAALSQAKGKKQYCQNNMFFSVLMMKMPNCLTFLPKKRVGRSSFSWPCITLLTKNTFYRSTDARKVLKSSFLWNVCFTRIKGC